MKISMSSLSVSIALTLSLLGPASSQTPIEIPGHKGEVITFPNGVASFADKVVDFQPGSPKPKQSVLDPAKALGVPDYPTKKNDAYTSFGKGGFMIVEFVDNRLVDIEGDDLYIFEVGPDVEDMNVEISENGTTWIGVGKIFGSTSYIDIRPFVKPGQQFRFVRLTDDPNEGDHSGSTPGADLDAVGAIGSIKAPSPQANNNAPNSGPNVPSTVTPKASRFFDAVVFFLPGKNTIEWSDTYPQRILGEPDQTTMGGGSLNLGEGGSVVVAMLDHLAIDGQGSDIVVYGELKGPLKVDVSADGNTWQTLGNVDAGKTSLELGPNRSARYVRLVDVNDGSWGSRIDAIGAVFTQKLTR